jgi:hypothetical protein
MTQLRDVRISVCSVITVSLHWARVCLDPTLSVLAALPGMVYSEFAHLKIEQLTKLSDRMLYGKMLR